MTTTSISLLIICVFAFVPLLIGELSRNESAETTDDFILNNRKLGTFPMYMTVFATWMSIFAFMGGVAYFYEKGPIYMTTIGWDILFAVLFIVIGRRIWHYGKQYGYVTPTDFFDDIYGSKMLNVLVIGIIIICNAIYLQVQITGGLLIIQIASNGTIEWYIAGIVFFAILVIYMWAGGLRAVARIDIFYGILLIAAILSAGFYLINVAGGYREVFVQIIEEDPANVSMAGSDGNHMVMLWISLFVIVPVGVFMGPHIWIRNYAAESEKNFNALPLLLSLSSIICIGTLFVGSAALVLVDSIDNPDSILISLMKEYAGPYFFIFLIIGMYAAIFSSANSQVHALAVVYTMDIHKRYINDKTPDKKLLFITRIAILIVAGISYVVLLAVHNNIFDMGVTAMGGLAQLIVPVLGGFFWKKSKPRGAIAGLLAGEIVFLICLLQGAGLEDSSIYALAGLIVNACFFIMISLIDKPRIKVEEKIEMYRREYRSKDY